MILGIKAGNLLVTPVNGDRILIRSLVPMEKKSHSCASLSVITAAANLDHNPDFDVRIIGCPLNFKLLHALMNKSLGASEFVQR